MATSPYGDGFMLDKDGTIGFHASNYMIQPFLISSHDD